MPVKHEFLFSSYKSSTQNLKIPTRGARLLFPPPSWRLYQRVTEQLQVPCPPGPPTIGRR